MSALTVGLDLPLLVKDIPQYSNFPIICDRHLLIARMNGDVYQRDDAGRAQAEADAAFIVRAVNNFEKLRSALITVANVGSGEAQRVALECLRSVDEGAS